MKQIPLFDRSLSLVLFGACFLIFIMITLGGLTRLTGSGLSIVEWKPISGIFPPFTVDDWQELFDSYQKSPEYIKINKGITLEGFKSLFWLEYIHRLWGRFIGLYFLLPLFLAWRKLSLRQTCFPFLIIIWLLGGLQGCVGWIMVKSGLVDNPHVSPYALAAHLLLAFFSYAMTLSAAIRLYPKKSVNAISLPSLSWIVAFFILTSFYGALVAGHKAGLLYNSFPLMGGQWIPEDAWFYKPFWINFFTNPATVQWIHRLLALTLVFLIVMLIWSSRLKPLTSWQHRGIGLTGVFTTIQLGLGISTLLCHVPVFLGLLHQAGSLFLFSSLLLTWEASKSASTPGSFFPSSHSRKAPPAVER